MIGLIIIGIVLLIEYGATKFFKSTSVAVRLGLNKNLIFYGIYCGSTLGLGFMLPIMAIFSVSEWLLLLILFLAILSEFIAISFYLPRKKM
jgi:hypothetical protein